ncbi:MAG TPA: hypothetical protein VG944_08625 [Fimbriimonas sp.]|nr:hypothetical protein [Fimbriimonas sp.]
MVLAAILLLAGLPQSDPYASVRADALRHAYGTYDQAPERVQKIGNDPESKRVDVEKLISQLEDLHVNTYEWLIWHESTDWDDLHRFLPLAQKAGINVWVMVTPPSENPPIITAHGYSEPFRQDYVKWGEEIAKLSLKYPNLKAWASDDFVIKNNRRKYTVDYIKEVMAKSRAINPKLAFVPIFYTMFDERGEWLKQFAGVVDGLQFSHRLLNPRNLNEMDPATPHDVDKKFLEDNVAEIHRDFGANFPVVALEYSSIYRVGKPPSNEKTTFLLKLGYEEAGSVLCYLHPSDTAPNRQAIKDYFTSLKNSGQ